MKQPVFLRIYLNGKLENVRQFTETQIVVGRNSDVQLPLADDAVAPLHAVIEERDAGYYISDLGSQHGTFLNGKKTFDEHLNSGDELQIGPYKVEFYIGVPKPKQAPAGLTQVTPLAKSDSSVVKPVEAPPPISEKVKPPQQELRTSTPVVQPPTSSASVKSVPPVPTISPMAAPQSGQADTHKVMPEVVAKSAPYVSATHKTFAPPTYVGDLSEKLKKSKGTTVEVVIAWKDRVLETRHFTDKCEVTIGSDEKCTIVIPLLGTNRPSLKLLKVDSLAKVCITHDMTGDYYKEDEHITLADLKRKNRVATVGSGGEIELMQGEGLRLGLNGDLLNIYIRYVRETPAPMVAPLLDLTASESTAVLMAFVIAAIFGLYMAIYSPKPLDEETKIEEPIRIATITFNPPPKKEIVKVDEAQETQKKVVKVDMKKTEQTTTKQDPGKAADIRPNPTAPKTKNAAAAVKQGGSINTGKAAANAQSETRDVTKMGLLSTFGGKGAQKELSKAYSGTGELLGDAAKATGSSGSAEDRAGESLGGRLKNVGGGGKGTATYGIAGVGTSGKGTGTFGSGTGGIGKKGRVDLNIGESEAEFSGSIDREAIRRVIRENIKQFENCYNMALRRNSDAYGKVEIKWYIEERGRATKASVKSNSLGDGEMGKCLARVIMGLTFPEPPQDQIAEVVYPFVFASQ